MFGDVTFRTGASQKKSIGTVVSRQACRAAMHLPTRRRARARARIRVAAEHGDHDAIRRRAAPRARHSRGRAGRVTPHGRGFGGPAATDSTSRARRRAHLLLRRIRRARAHRLPHVRPMERISGRDGDVRRRRGARDPRSGRRPRASVVIVNPRSLVLRPPRRRRFLRRARRAQTRSGGLPRALRGSPGRCHRSRAPAPSPASRRRADHARRHLPEVRRARRERRRRRGRRPRRTHGYARPEAQHHDRHGRHHRASHPSFPTERGRRRGGEARTRRSRRVRNNRPRHPAKVPGVVRRGRPSDHARHPARRGTRADEPKRSREGEDEG